MATLLLVCTILICIVGWLVIGRLGMLILQNELFDSNKYSEAVKSTRFIYACHIAGVITTVIAIVVCIINFLNDEVNA